MLEPHEHEINEQKWLRTIYVYIYLYIYIYIYIDRCIYFFCMSTSVRLDIDVAGQIKP